MNQKPLLIFPSFGDTTKRESLPPRNFSAGTSYPDKATQAHRLGGSITNLDRVFRNQTANFHSGIVGQIPEMILVFEIIGNIPEFFSAIKKTPGMEYLGEQQYDMVEPDEFFYSIDNDGEQSNKLLEKRIFLSLTNNEAITELQRYWEKYQNDNQLPHGAGKYNDLFQQLKDIRPYSIEDRIRDTGLRDYLTDLKKDGVTEINFEIELTYREDEKQNIDSFTVVENLIVESGGEIISSSRVTIPDIYYHACIGKAPIELFDDLSENTNIQFLKSEKILFFRPVGQTISKLNTEDIEKTIEKPVVDNISADNDLLPVAALLDGLPLSNHHLLAGRLIIDDLNNVEKGYLAEGRIHGTTMASLILNGDLNDEDEEKFARPLYAYPIMKLRVFGQQYWEELPNDKLPIDIIHQAIKRMFEGINGEEPTAPSVKIINLSIGDGYRPFHFNLSSWAKFIDWLSEKYNVLFIVSAGNFTGDIILDIEEAAFLQLSENDKRQAVGNAIIKENYLRKILTPAEAINAITVGASHDDNSSGNMYPNARIDLVNEPDMINMASRVGFGYRQSIKPEILMPGGQQLYRRKHTSRTDKSIFSVESNSFNPHPPGNRVAIPSKQNKLNETIYTFGTSNAAALATRLGIKIHDVLTNLEGSIPDKYLPVLIKALLVHGASRGRAVDFFEQNFRQHEGISNSTIKKHIGAYLGFGKVKQERVLYCTDQRVTLIGFGELTKEKMATFRFPLPDSIASVQLQKKLTITLAWLTPVNPQSGKYRKSHLFFGNISSYQDDVSFNRIEYDFDNSKRGTVQHDCLIGSKADAYMDGTDLVIKVSCKQDARGFKIDTKVKFGLAVTFEILNNNSIKIYNEIQSRINQRIQVENA